MLQCAQGAELRAQQRLKERAVAIYLAGTGRCEAAAKEAPLPVQRERGGAELRGNRHGRWEPEESLGTPGGMARLGRLEEISTRNAVALLAAAHGTVPLPPRPLRVAGPPAPGS